MSIFCWKMSNDEKNKNIYNKNASKINIKFIPKVEFESTKIV